MRNVLARLSATDLTGLIGRDNLEAISRLLPESVVVDADHGSPQALAEVLLAVRGPQLLEESKLRSRLLRLLPAEDLKSMAQLFAKRALAKPADNALILSKVPWKHGTAATLEIGDRLRVPAEFLPRMPSRASTAETIERWRPLPELRDYQDDVKARVALQILEGSSRILLQMPTGAGKTRTMMEAVCSVITGASLFDHGLSVLWLAHVEELCDQAADVFATVWRGRGSRSATLLRCWGPHRPNVDDYAGAFIVASYQKLSAMRRTNPKELEALGKRCRLVVADEAHKVLAPTFRAVLETVEVARAPDSTCIIGLTATPGRGLEQNRENAKLAQFFNKNLVSPDLSEEPIAELRRRGVLADVTYRPVTSGDTVQLSASEQRVAQDLDMPTTVLQRLAGSPHRNRRIIELLEDELTHNRSCLLFSCTVEHSRILAAALTLRGHSVGHLDSGVPRMARQSLIERFRAGEVGALLNYGVLSTGFDVPAVSTVVITRPTTSVVLYSQMIGRGLRGPASGGNRECLVIDVRDNFTSFGGVDDVYAAFSDYWTRA